MHVEAGSSSALALKSACVGKNVYMAKINKLLYIVLRNLVLARYLLYAQLHYFKEDEQRCMDSTDSRVIEFRRQRDLALATAIHNWS